jgi:U4/U6.U5 tri-snRNP-associated protein 2
MENSIDLVLEFDSGYVGLNNLNQIDYINVLVQALVHVQPLRDFFLLNSSPWPSELGISP